MHRIFNIKASFRISCISSFMRVTRGFIFAAICAITLSLVFSDFGFAQDKIIAVVNKDVITQRDLNDFINFMRVQLMAKYKDEEEIENRIQAMKPDLIDKLIEDRLILQEARKNDSKVEIQPNVWVSIRPDENRVKARIDEIKKRFGSEKEFQDSLREQGFTQADIESKISDQLLMYNIIEYRVKSKIVVNPTEVTDFYQKNIEEFTIPEQRDFESLKVNQANLAEEILSKLKEGKALGDLAKEYSLTINALTVSKGQELRKEIEDIVFNLKIGESSQIIKMEDGFYIFRIDKIIPSRQKSLSEVQDGIYAMIFDNKMQERLTGWLAEIKEQSYIKIIEQEK